MSFCPSFKGKEAPKNPQKIHTKVHEKITTMNALQKGSPFCFLKLGQTEDSLLRKRDSGVKVLETTVGAVFAHTSFSLVRISNRDLVADRNPQ